MKLYEINASIRELIDSGMVVDTETGELLFEGPEGLDQLEVARTEKLLAVAAVIKETKAEANAFSEERKKIEAKLKARENQLERKIAWLTGYLEANMELGEKAKDSLTSIGWRSSKSVEVPSPELLPQAYQRVKVEADKVALKAALEAGEAVAGAVLVEKMSLQVR